MKNTKNNISNNEQKSKLLIPKIDVVFHSLFRTHKEELTSNFVSSLLQNKVKIIDIIEQAKQKENFASSCRKTM